jgi:hypothetical protein
MQRHCDTSTSIIIFGSGELVAATAAASLRISASSDLLLVHDFKRRALMPNGIDLPNV